jgi:hypothetical protein
MRRTVAAMLCALAVAEAALASGEIQVANGVTGSTMYAVVRDSTARAWRADTSAWEAYQAAHLASYAVTLTEQGSASGYFVTEGWPQR